MADTTLGQAVLKYNASHSQWIVMYVVSEESQGVDEEMYRDLLTRGWRIMGPEDFAESVVKPGWPYIVIAREDALNANSVQVWGYVLEHEFVHMVAAANLAREGLNLADLMRNPDGAFTHRARFHEVCADFYPRDETGDHRPVAPFYGAMTRMPELIAVLETYDLEALSYHPPPDYEILTITDIPVLDAACVWDRGAMETVRDLYDARRGEGAFDLLFPIYR